jgi:hypothetical protein
MSWPKLRIFFVVIASVIVMIAVDRLTLPVTTPAMHAEAEAYATERNKAIPPRAFKFDGCSMFFDSLPGYDFTHACLQHDIAYWIGGSPTERSEADIAFRAEISSMGSLGPLFAPVMYAGVHIFGDTWLARIINANWGWGWNE